MDQHSISLKFSFVLATIITQYQTNQKLFHSIKSYDCLQVFGKAVKSICNPAAIWSSVSSQNQETFWLI